MTQNKFWFDFAKIVGTGFRTHIKQMKDVPETRLPVFGVVMKKTPVIMLWTIIFYSFVTSPFFSGLVYSDTHSQLINSEVFVYRPLELNTPVLNPGYGFTLPSYGYIQYLPESVRQWCDIAYRRFLWAEIEPREGQYSFKTLLKWIKDRKKNGYRVSLGFMSSNTSKQCTPLWLFDKGVPGVSHRNGQQIDPVYWDEKYLDQLTIFIKALGTELNGGEGIEFIDMRNIGVYGEMHFGSSKEGMWTKEELVKYGLTEANYINAYIRMIHAYQEAFPKADLVLNIAPGRERANRINNTQGYNWVTPSKDQVIDYAVKAGVNIRYDGLSKSSIEFGVISSYYQQYGHHESNKRNGVKCIYEFAAAENEVTTIQGLLSKALADPVSYINLNFARFEKMNDETIQVLYDAAKKIGYRFLLTEIKCRAQTMIASSSFTNIELEQTWLNKGAAPCYKEYAIKYSILDDRQKTICESNGIPDPPAWKWFPGKPVKLLSSISIPNDIKDGIYQLKLQMYDMENEIPIKLAFDGFDGNNSYHLFRFSIQSNGKQKTITPF